MDRDVIAVHAELEERHWWFAARRRILRRLVDALLARGAPPAPAAPVLLDVGCGVGANLVAFHPDYRCIGFDPSPDAIEMGARRHPGLDLRVGGADEARETVRIVDVLLLNDVIEHVADDRALLASLVREMRPGALLVVTVPADMRLWSPHDEALGHLRRYDHAMLARAVDGLPLERLFVSHFNARLYPVALAARTFSRRRRKALGTGGVDLRPTPAPVNALLRSIFEGEIPRLLRVVAGTAAPYRRGVSIAGAWRRLGQA